MPIVDIQAVMAPGETLPEDFAQRCADALGRVWQSQPGRVWVRVGELPMARYAENDATLSAQTLPLFVTVLQADRPTSQTRSHELQRITDQLAAVSGRPGDRIHLVYDPPGRGRVAFGGEWLG